MAGTLTVTTINSVSTINAATGVLATQNGMTGIAKAWVQYNATTQVINGSFNVSSVTYTAAGNFTINFTTAMGNVNYAPVVSCNNIDVETKIQFATIASGSLQIRSQGSVNVNSSYNPVFGCAVFGS